MRGPCVGNQYRRDKIRGRAYLEIVNINSSDYLPLQNKISRLFCCAISGSQECWLGKECNDWT